MIEHLRESVETPTEKVIDVTPLVVSCVVGSVVAEDDVVVEHPLHFRLEILIGQDGELGGGGFGVIVWDTRDSRLTERLHDLLKACEPEAALLRVGVV